MMIQTSVHTVKKLAFLIAALLLMIWCAAFFLEITMLLLGAFLLSFILTPFVDFLEHYGVHRTTATVGVFVLLGGSIVLLLLWLVPVLVDQGTLLVQTMKEVDIERQLQQVAKDIEKRFPFLQAAGFASSVHSFLQSIAESVVTLATKAVSLAMALIIIPFIAFFLVKDARRGMKNLVERVPNRYFEVTLNIVYSLMDELADYVRGWLLDSTIVGAVMTVGYFVIDVRYAVVLGIIAGISNLVPYVGPIAGIIPAVIVAVIQGGSTNLIINIVLLTIIVQLIDNTVIQPWAFSNAMNIHPMLVLLVILVGSDLGNVLGMLFAVPVLTIIMVTTKQAYWGFTRYALIHRRTIRGRSA